MKHIPNLTPRAYHGHKFDTSKLPNLKEAGYLSASTISAARDPLKMIYCPYEESDAMQWGSLVDCLWTTPTLFASEYCLIPDDAPRDLRKDSRVMNAKKPSQDSLDAIAWWNTFDAEVAGRTLVKQSELDDAKAAISMLNQNALSKSIWDVSMKQVALVGDSPMHGGKAKGLLDLLPMEGPFVDAIVDLKTTGAGISEHAIASTAWTYDYAVKLAWYGVLAEAAGFGPRPRGVLIWQSSKFPFEVKTREVPQALLRAARLGVIKRRIDVLCQINPSDMRPHFDIELKEMPLHDWQMNAMMGQG
jgi:hypothetical protein